MQCRTMIRQLKIVSSRTQVSIDMLRRKQMVQGVTRQAHFRKQLCIRIVQQIAYTDSPINISKTNLYSTPHYTVYCTLNHMHIIQITLSTK